MRIRFINCRILTMKNPDVFEGELWVNNDTIEYVGEAKQTEEVFDRVIDCKGNVLMPSFKNAHAHSAMTFSRSLADNLPLDVWLNTKIFPMEGKLTPEHVYWFTKLAVMEYVKCGTTLAFDMYFHHDSYAKVSDETGFRFAFVSGMNDFGGFEDLESKYLKFNNYSDLISYNMGFHAEYTTSMELMKKLSELSHKYEEPIYVHNSETRKEVEGCISRYGKTPTQVMDDIGLFDFGGGGFHCVHMSEEDYEIFRKRDLLAVFNPCSNLKLSSGIADIKKFIDMGINVSVGTDGAGSNNSLNIFRDLYLASVLPNVRGEGEANVDPFVLLKGVTSVGPHYMKFKDCDYLEAGKKADIILIDMKDPSMQPVNNFAVNLVYSGSPDSVKMTMINGQIVYENGEFKTIDSEEVIKKCNVLLNEIRL